MCGTNGRGWRRKKEREREKLKGIEMIERNKEHKRGNRRASFTFDHHHDDVVAVVSHQGEKRQERNDVRDDRK